MRLSDWTLNQRSAMLKVKCNILRERFSGKLNIIGHWQTETIDWQRTKTQNLFAQTNRFALRCVICGIWCHRLFATKWIVSATSMNFKIQSACRTTETNASAVHRVLSFAQHLSRKAKRQRCSNFNFPAVRTLACIRFPFYTRADCRVMVRAFHAAAPSGGE